MSSSTTSQVDPLQQLKSILLNEDQQRIQELEQEIERLREQLNEKDHLIETLEPVIADLLDRKIKHSKDEVAAALAPVMSEAIKRQIRDAKEDVVDALYPILGRMVTKAVAEAMKKLVENINTTLNKTFDFKLWIKRMKARFLGIDAGAVIVAESVPFDLQEIFLISKKAGLLIAYASMEEQNASDNDAQVIGGMLTAIKSFVEDAFSEGKESELLEIEYSDLTIRIDSGRYTYLAAVYSGVRPPEFDQQLHRLHINIHDAYHQQLRDYSGDNSQLHGIEAALNDLLKKTHSVQ